MHFEFYYYHSLWCLWKQSALHLLVLPKSSYLSLVGRSEKIWRSVIWLKLVKRNRVWAGFDIPIFHWETTDVSKKSLQSALLTISFENKLTSSISHASLGLKNFFSTLATLYPPASQSFFWGFPDLVLKLRWSSSKLRCCCIKRCQPACCSLMVSGLRRWTAKENHGSFGCVWNALSLLVWSLDVQISFEQALETSNISWEGFYGFRTPTHQLLRRIWMPRIFVFLRKVIAGLASSLKGRWCVWYSRMVYLIEEDDGDLPAWQIH